MSDVDRLLDWFAAGLLVRPDAATPGTVHLARAMATLCGAPVELDGPSRTIGAAIGESDHYVFVLADGLGMNVIEPLPDDSFLRRHLATPISSAFPSSTAPALTAVATGLWPAEHGVPGWHVYLRDRDLHAVTLPFVERLTGKPLHDLGLQAEDLFAAPVLWAHLQRDAAFFMPRRIHDSVYTRYCSGGQPVLPYDTLAGAIDTISARVTAAPWPTFTYLYYSAVDTAAHIHGPSSAQVAAEVEYLDEALGRLADALAAHVRIVVSADHGGYDVQRDQKLVVEPGDAISELLLTPPSGEPPAAIFHVRPGHQDDFAARFRSRAAGSFALLSVDEVDDLRLLGPNPLSDTTRARLGDFVAISAHGEAVAYSKEAAIVKMKGFHGGLQPREVSIPLVVA